MKIRLGNTYSRFKRLNLTEVWRSFRLAHAGCARDFFTHRECWIMSVKLIFLSGLHSRPLSLAEMFATTSVDAGPCARDESIS